MSRVFYLITFICLVVPKISKGQIDREFRGVWVASVANIDWPSKPGLSASAQQQEFIDLLNLHKRNGMNAVIVQVRPSADAFYESRYEPWSKWLTGKLDSAPYPYYDPLKFMIQEAHERGLEFHAWFNPYRAVVDATKNGIDNASIAFQKPEWMVRYGNHVYFDPGIPGARKHTLHVIMEVVNRYDVDAIHFDDYFYPYKIKDLEFPDSSSFKIYGMGFTNKDDWRRNNVNLLIKELSDSIHQVKPYVQFGISPFGVWRNQDKDPSGSATQAGQTCYDDLYANILLWMKEKWIDYVLPQIYWPIGFDIANYEVIAKWWDQNSYEVPVYIGQAAYRVANNSDVRWKDPTQIGNQIRLNRSLKNIRGSAFFSSKSFHLNPLGLNDTLRSIIYHQIKLPPVIRKPASVMSADYTIDLLGGSEGIMLLWKESKDVTQLNKHHRYVVYRIDKGGRQILATLSSINNSSIQSFKDATAKRRKRYQYGVSVLDHYNQESNISYSLEIVNRKSSWRTFQK